MKWFTFIILFAALVLTAADTQTQCVSCPPDINKSLVDSITADVLQPIRDSLRARTAALTEKQDSVISQVKKLQNEKWTVRTEFYNLHFAWWRYDWYYKGGNYAFIRKYKL